MPSSSAARIRGFVALALDAALGAEIEKVQQRLSSPGGAVRWVSSEQLHLTLQFLGHVPGDRLDALAVALGDACSGIAPFQLALEGVGCFPNTRNPRVVWIGIQGALEPLRMLQERIAKATKDFGDHDEPREFQPHLTIGRVKAFGAEGRKVGQTIERANAPKLGDWDIQEVLLVQSELSPDGARYATRATVALDR